MKGKLSISLYKGDKKGDAVQSVGGETAWMCGLPADDDDDWDDDVISAEVANDDELCRVVTFSSICSVKRQNDRSSERSKRR